MSAQKMNPKRSVDTTGLYCPEPIFRLRTAVDELEDDDVLEMLADDPAAEDDVRRWVKRTGHRILDFSRDGHTLRFTIQKRSRQEDNDN